MWYVYVALFTLLVGIYTAGKHPEEDFSFGFLVFVAAIWPVFLMIVLALMIQETNARN